jgi:MscS family membrane protein
MLNDLITSITTNQYLVALIYLAIFFILIRFGVWVVEKVILKLTIKTKTDLDDLIIKVAAKPLTWIAFLFSLKISIGKITIAESMFEDINVAVNTFVTIVGVYLVYKIFNISLSRVWKKFSKKAKVKHNDALIQLTSGVLKVVLIVFGILYVLSLWGFEIGPILTGLGIGGIAIAFALQESLANIFGGVSMILDRSVNVGDLVNLEGNVSGKILKIGLRSTKVKTFDNEIVIVPNSKLASGNIHNVAQPDPVVRVVVPFGVAYGSDVDKVKKLVLAEIKKVKHIVKDPAPFVKFLEMADSSLNFKAYFFVETFDVRLGALDEANTRIYNVLNKAGIEIPFPQMDVNIKK